MISPCLASPSSRKSRCGWSPLPALRGRCFRCWVEQSTSDTSFFSGGSSRLALRLSPSECSFLGRCNFFLWASSANTSATFTHRCTTVRSSLNARGGISSTTWACRSAAASLQVQVLASSAVIAAVWRTSPRRSRSVRTAKETWNSSLPPERKRVLFLDKKTRMSVKVIKEVQAVATPPLVHESLHSFGSPHPIVIKYHQPACNKSRPQPLTDVLGRFVHINVDMTEPEAPVLNSLCRLLGENARQYIDIVESELAQQAHNNFDGSVGVHSIFVNGVFCSRFDHASKCVAQKHLCGRTALCALRRDQRTSAAAPDSHLQ